MHACVQLCPPRPRGLCKHTCTQQNTVTPKPQTRTGAAALSQCNLFPWKTCRSHMNTACATGQPGLSSQAANVPSLAGLLAQPARPADVKFGDEQLRLPISDHAHVLQACSPNPHTHLMCTLEMDSCRLPITVSITAFSMPPTPPPPAQGREGKAGRVQEPPHGPNKRMQAPHHSNCSMLAPQLAKRAYHACVLYHTRTHACPMSHAATLQYQPLT